MKKIVVVILLIAAMAAGGFWFKSSEDTIPSVIQPITGPAVQAVYATGTVEPTVMMPIAPRSGARLMKLFVDEGAEVKKGDILGQLEDTDLQKSVEELTAKLDLAEKEFSRKDRLRKSGAVSKQAIDSTKTALDAAKAALEQVQAQQDYLRLIAPADGRILKRDGEEGQFIPSGQAVFYMECCAPLRVTAEVDEEDIPLVKVGQKVIITADAFPGETYNGAVLAITPKGDAVSRSYRVRISLDGQTPLMTGMTAENNIMIRENENALLLPSTAIKDNKIWVVQDGKISIRSVKIGAQAMGAAEILEGVAANDLVLEKADALIEDGQSISVHTGKWSLQK